MHGQIDQKPEVIVRGDVVPLQQAHVWKAAATWVEAYAKDPELSYQRDGQKQSSAVKAFDRIIVAGLITLLMKKRVALTIESGAAFVLAKPGHSETGAKNPIGKVVSAIISGLAAVLSRRIGTAEQRKRNQEVEQKTQKALDMVLGDRVKDMLTIMILATEPSSQKRGYGGALLDAVTSLADITGQACWLNSSNIENKGFYESHGFQTVAEIVIGNENPTWHHPPIIAEIMVREPRRW
ncbi:hypothetical protein M413DRAFT_441454 [Hebeloma cylindrosporum]|uniref:N-acetyltransferase domain-containing protein n=1 Tax=Hebeloma cylindrosporum TaxID=76867 RepID=A0A0C2YZG0_HEBCY|nr:hypothetical protein M413DRAFT_441454 [Hebeloma cylindrosporum h7]